MTLLPNQPKTTFTCDGKRSMFCVVPFGLKSMTGHMQRIMESLLGDLALLPMVKEALERCRNAKHIE